MDVQTLNREEREQANGQTEEMRLAQERIHRLEAEKHTLTLSSIELRKELEQSLESFRTLSQTHTALQAQTQALSTLNLLLESQLRTSKLETENVKSELSGIEEAKRGLETDLQKTREALTKARTEIIEAEMREKAGKYELELGRNAQIKALKEAENRSEESRLRAARLETDGKEMENRLRAEIGRIRGDLRAKSEESDQRGMHIETLSVQCTDLSANLTRLTDQMQAVDEKWREILDLKDAEIIELKEKSGVLPLLNFPTENKEQVAFLMDKMTDLQRRYTQANAKADTFEKQLRLLLEEVERKAPILAEQKSNYEDLCVAYATLKADSVSPQSNDSSELTQQVSILQEKLSFEERENDRLRKDSSVLAVQVRTLLIEIHRLRYGGDVLSSPSLTFKSAEELQIENQRLRSDLATAETRGNEGKDRLMEAAGREIAAQRELIEKLTRQIRLSEELLGQGYVPISKIDQALSLRVEKETQMRLKIADLEADLNYFQTKTGQLEKTIKELQTENDGFRRANSLLNKDLSDQQAKFLRISNDLSVAQAASKSLNDSLSSAKQDIERLKDLNEKRAFENRDLRERYGLETASANSLQARVLEAETAHRREVEKFIEERETIYGQWRAREQELIDTKKRWRDEVSRLKADLENLTAELHSANANFDLETRSEVIQFRLQISELKALNLDLEEAHRKLLKDYEALALEHKRAIEEVQRLSDIYQNYRLKERCGMAEEDAETRTGMYYEVLGSLRTLQEDHFRLVAKLREVQGKVVDLEDSLAREKALYLQEVSHSSQLQTTLIQCSTRLERAETELRNEAEERVKITAELNRKEQEWSEAQDISAGNFQYIREFQTQISQMRREKVELEVKYKEMMESHKIEIDKLQTDKRNTELIYASETSETRQQLENAKSELLELKESVAKRRQTGDFASKATLGKLTALMLRCQKAKIAD